MIPSSGIARLLDHPVAHAASKPASDVGNTVAQSFGLVYALPEELRSALRSNNKALPGINGDESWELPVPATYVIDQDRRVGSAFIDVDYRNRLNPEVILSVLKTLRPDAPKIRSHDETAARSRPVIRGNQ